MDRDIQGFVIYRDYREYCGFLSNEEKGLLLDALFGYAFEGEKPEGLSPVCALAFSVMKNQMDRDFEKYERKCEKNRKNGALGGRPKKEKPSKADDSKEEAIAEAEGADGKTRAKAAEVSEGETKADAAESAFDKLQGEEYFRLFWEEYPRKEGKKAARDAFLSLPCDYRLMTAIMDGVCAGKDSEQWKREGGRFIPLAQNWLSGRRWEDEASPPIKEEPHSSFDTDDFFEAALRASYENCED